jgi:hypothetical protein
MPLGTETERVGPADVRGTTHDTTHDEVRTERILKFCGRPG